jgi:hypothetical protein
MALRLFMQLVCVDHITFIHVQSPSLGAYLPVNGSDRKTTCTVDVGAHGARTSKPEYLCRVPVRSAPSKDASSYVSYLSSAMRSVTMIGLADSLTEGE